MRSKTSLIFWTIFLSVSLTSCLRLFPEADLEQQIMLLKPGTITLPDQKIVPWQLIVFPPKASAHLNTNLIAVEEKNPTVHYVSGTVWSDDLVDMVQNLVVDAFLSTNKILGVSGSSQALNPTYGLNIDINQFGLDISRSSEYPQAVINISGQISNFNTRQVVAMQHFDVRVQSQGKSVVQISEAFNKALEKLFADLVPWTLNVDKK